MLVSSGFILKRNYCFHRQIDSMRSITGFCCWYTVFIENMDIVCYIKMWFLSLSPAIFLLRRELNSLSILPLWNDLLALQDEFYAQLVKESFLLAMVHPYKLNTSKIFLTLTSISKSLQETASYKKAEWSEWIIWDHMRNRKAQN